MAATVCRRYSRIRTPYAAANDNVDHSGLSFPITSLDPEESISKRRRQDNGKQTIEFHGDEVSEVWLEGGAIVKQRLIEGQKQLNFPTRRLTLTLMHMDYIVLAPRGVANSHKTHFSSAAATRFGTEG